MLPCTPYSCQVTSSALPDDGERARLTKDAVAQRALEVADRVGPEALTIRKLATELGVTPMALYWHFRSKDDLLTGVADRIWGEVDIAVDWSAPWTDQLQGMFTSLLSVLRAHPAAPQLLLRTEKLHSEAAMKATETALEVLRRAGFSPEDASAIARAAMWTALMLVMAEPGIEFPDPEERAEEQRKHQVELATLPQAKFPRLVECALPMTACDDPEEHYKFGVEMFMAGVAAIAATRAKQPPASPGPEG
jgi:TetR/AcrR family tetracycline transcriptional repressor